MKNLFSFFRTFSLSDFKIISSCSAILLLMFLLGDCSDSSKKQLFENFDNIGSCKLPGGFVYNKDKDMYTLSGSGYDMWFETDEFSMAWKEVSGDFKLSADVALAGEGTHELRKMGLIIRESLDPDAVHANVALHGNGLAALQFRLEKGGETFDILSDNNTPEHIVMERVGNTIIMRTGNREQPDATVELVLPQKSYVGLFICSHEVDELETGYFSNVRLEQK